MKKFLIMLLVKIRWCYFHIHPHYLKFKIENEEHFQNIKNGTIHSSITWVDAKVNTQDDWKHVSKVLPPEGEPFQAFHKDWIDEDFNVNGIRECHRYGDGSQYCSAMWFDEQDCWIRSDKTPELWRHYVKPATVGGML